MPGAVTAIMLTLTWWTVGAATLVAAPTPGRPPATGPGPSAFPLAIATMSVDIWPEHDDPRLLVIYRGTLATGAPLPQTLTFTIPATGQVNAAAYRTDDGQLFSTPHQYRQEADRLMVTFTVPARGFQFEYYVDTITGLPQRTFAVDLQFPLDVENLKVSIKQPLRSSAFTLIPPDAGTTDAPGGFTHHFYEVGRWPAAKAWQVRATYKKADGNPSVLRAVQTPESGPSAPAAAGLPRWLWGAGGAAFLGLAGVGLLGYRRSWWMLRRPRAADRVYCGHCSARARRGDRFCSRCGQPLAQA